MSTSIQYDVTSNIVLLIVFEVEVEESWLKMHY
jgi:hypothetical protein